MATRPKHPTVTLLRLGSFRVTLLNGKADWREYLTWQLGLLASALSLLMVFQLIWSADALDTSAALSALLATLPGIALAAVILWWLIGRAYSRSKRFALAFLILAGLLAALCALRTYDVAPGGAWFDLLLFGTAAYLAGTGLIGLIIFIRGDDVSPWWKR